MRSTWRAFTALALAGLAGCGQLQVQVDVLDREYVRAEANEESMRQTFRHIVSSQPGEIGARVDRKYADYQREVLKLSEKYTALAPALPDGPKASLLDIAAGLRQSMLRGTPVQTAQKVAIDLETRAQAIRAHPSTSSWSGRGAIPAELRSLLVEFDVAAKSHDSRMELERRSLTEDIRGIQLLAAPAAAGAAAPPAEAPAAKEAKAQEAVVAAVARRSIVEGSELSNTEFAYLVASAPESLWKSNYNQAFGSGTFGNVDVVIRMNSTADFSVKGMRFDATTVAAVASKVLTQSVLLGAQIAGVPVASATSGTSTGGDALSKSSADLAAADAAMARREAFLEGQRNALRALARAVLGARTQMETAAFKGQAATARSGVHQPIDSTLSSLRPLIAMQDLQ